MNECIIKINTIEIKNSIFDNIIDRTYVILCCGETPERLKNVEKYIKILKPTRYVDFYYFKGYKNCPKSIHSNNDIINNNITIFKDAISKKYNRILVLEDDFFLHKPLEQKDINNITKFIKKNNPYFYSLGCFGIPTIKTMLNTHQKLTYNMTGGAHANIYNKDLLDKYINYIDNITSDTLYTTTPDFIFSNINNIKTYRYYKPLIYQTFPETNNQKNSWKITLGKFTPIAICGIKILGLNKSEYPGYQILYNLPLVLYIILILLIIYFIIKIIR